MCRSCKMSVASGMTASRGARCRATCDAECSLKRCNAGPAVHSSKHPWTAEPDREDTAAGPDKCRRPTSDSTENCSMVLNMADSLRQRLVSRSKRPNTAPSSTSNLGMLVELLGRSFVCLGHTNQGLGSDQRLLFSVSRPNARSTAPSVQGMHAHDNCPSAWSAVLVLPDAAGSLSRSLRHSSGAASWLASPNPKDRRRRIADL